MHHISLIKKVSAFVLALSASVISGAQTDYDISVFLENIGKEVPKTENMDFYLNAGNRLLSEGRLEEADVFFDFAASLGSEDGFRGKAAAAKGKGMKDYHTVFAERGTPNADRLMTSLAAAREDVSAAILVHDNIDIFRLDYLHDPLLDWMPANPEDSVWLRQNDGVTYMIAHVKEDAGNRYAALSLYEIAAWEGNYEALMKTGTIGTAKERKWKRVLIDFMDRKEEVLLLHRYLSGGELKGYDYFTIMSYLSTPDERLISYALAFPEPDPALESIGVQPSGDYGIQSLKEFVRDHPRWKYSKDAIAFIRKYYKKNQKPWADRVLKIVSQLPVDNNARYSRSDNYYYPLFEKGLFSKLHHTQEVLPVQLDPGI